jgi:hypothetical protein
MNRCTVEWSVKWIVSTVKCCGRRLVALDETTSRDSIASNHPTVSNNSMNIMGYLYPFHPAIWGGSELNPEKCKPHWRSHPCHTSMDKSLVKSLFPLMPVGGGYENQLESPNTRVAKQDHKQEHTSRERWGDKESSKACACLKSCESLYTCPRAPLYRETKGLLHSKITLKSKEYSKCEYVQECLLHPVICGANFIHLQACQ